ncbi:DUF3040 domain-containing protein [Pseudonocardia sp. GCM10023141]|uniref:DUF3040 domain-containing protein n=1 Tax=Pseudonocardia sp. GCM10023141 TaxID=3252653 RepID=UPI00360E33CA
MLSQDDRRRFAEIERALEASDPAFAQRFRRGPRQTDWLIATAVLAVVIGTVGILLGLALVSVVILLPSACLLVGGWTTVRRRRRERSSS